MVFSVYWLFDERLLEDLTADDDAVVILLNVSLDILKQDVRFNLFTRLRGIFSF